MELSVLEDAYITDRIMGLLEGAVVIEPEEACDSINEVIEEVRG